MLRCPLNMETCTVPVLLQPPIQTRTVALTLQARFCRLSSCSMYLCIDIATRLIYLPGICILTDSLGIVDNMCSRPACSCFLRYTFPSLKLAACQVVARAYRTSTHAIPLLFPFVSCTRIPTSYLDRLKSGSCLGIQKNPLHRPHTHGPLALKYSCTASCTSLCIRAAFWKENSTRCKCVEDSPYWR
jgi:hypothetical protein